MKKYYTTGIRSTLLATSFGLSAFAFSASADAATVVDTEISFLIDVSGSISSSEYALQIDGYVNAFKSLDFSGKNFAANFILWSSGSQQAEVVSWTHINDNTSASAFADAIAAATATRPFSGGTDPGSAINFAVPLFGTETGGTDNGFLSNRQIIDVSGDGTGGSNTPIARDSALAAGVDAINGLPIGDASLAQWYQDNIVGGTGSFLISASDFADFEAAIMKKIELETGGGGGGGGTTVPEPSTLMSLIGLAAFGVVSVRKRKQQQQG